MTIYRYLEPLDVLYLRGNKLFGDPGSFGESLIPPRPSVAAGALRSAILVADGIDLAEFAAGRITHPRLGTPTRPGGFAVTDFELARRHADGRAEPLRAPPADLVLACDDAGVLTVTRLSAQAPSPALSSSAALAKVPVLADSGRRKPVSGYWLNESGWQCYLAGHSPAADDLIDSSRLWQLDLRIGVGLDPVRRRADDGKLFSMQAVAMNAGVGFVVGFIGGDLGAGSMLRFGGDGRVVVVYEALVAATDPDHDAIARQRRCRIVLTTPGVFPNGWRLPGAAADGSWQLGGISARLVCAAVPRAETVSGWDLSAWRPKPAQRAVPAGSVYWLEELDASAEQLRALVARGLWDGDENAERRAEGFNRFTFAVY